MLVKESKSFSWTCRMCEAKGGDDLDFYEAQAGAQTHSTQEEHVTVIRFRDGEVWGRVYPRKSEEEVL